ncbi:MULTISPECIES: hypothetical protein [Pseudomonas]|uniref:hypothetical protein n=1 Tax=Pseudomonas TaxID=286 RepID=UPI000812830D|nr:MULTISPECIES: hypothetical protein [Pseudomonas]WGT26608.1 hypothetical protein QGQ83_23475 [Pseudomonas marginalis]CRM83174.1 hypothetical protein [Pseudomonas sp. 35 E 8]
MPEKLPINLNDLLRQRTVEDMRIEYKAGWIRTPFFARLRLCQCLETWTAVMWRSAGLRC